MKPWGIVSSRKCAAKDAPAAIRNFSRVSIPGFIAKTDMMHAEEMWVVVVILILALAVYISGTR